MSRRVLCRFVASTTLVLSLGMSILAPTAAQAGVLGFTGFNNWTLTSNPSLGDGSVNNTLAPATVLISGSDSPGAADFFEDNYADFTRWAAGTGLVSFRGTYSSSDTERFDGFGSLRNGNFTELATKSSQLPGSVRFSGLQGDIFGFRVFSAGKDDGVGDGKISPYDVVPEPTSMAIFGFGALALSYRARRKSKS